MSETTGIPVELFASIVRIEFLLEEVIFQLISARFPNESNEFQNEKFKIALDNVKRQFDATFPDKTDVK